LKHCRKEAAESPVSRKIFFPPEFFLKSIYLIRNCDGVHVAHASVGQKIVCVCVCVSEWFCVCVCVCIRIYVSDFGIRLQTRGLVSSIQV
jgi:hypothetical protein